MDAVFNDKGETMPVNVPNRGTLPGFDDELVVETVGRCGADWVTPLPQPPLPHHVRGLVEALAEYQWLAGEAAWHGDRATALRALVANPLVRTVDRAERAYGLLAEAHRHLLPASLLA